MKVKTIEINICQACLDGVGEECHTPGCAFFLKPPPENGLCEYLYQVLHETEE